MLIRTVLLVLFYVILLLAMVPVLLTAMIFGIREPLVNIGKGAMRLSRVILGLRVEVEGLPEEDDSRPRVYMSNHVSLLDGPLIFMLIRRPIRVIMKTSVFRLPVVGPGMRFVGFVPVDRRGEKTGRGALEAAARMMRDKGYSFLIFPEGTRSRTGKLQPLRRGGFFLARSAEAPIVPVSVRGTLEILPKGKLLPKKGTIRVVFHPAIPFPGPSPEGMDAWMAAVRERLSVGSD
jgi:1-acyl-sn-glycerol-3-phosphate acyltransferase